MSPRQLPTSLQRRRGAGGGLLLFCAAVVAADFVAHCRAPAFVAGAPWRVADATSRPRHLPAVGASSGRRVARQAQETGKAHGLLDAERYIAMNRFRIKDGAGPGFEQRWAQRKTALSELPGFRWFSLLRRVPPTGEAADYEYPDDYSYASFTNWASKAHFNEWRKGPGFKEAHGGDDPLAFVGKIVDGFMMNKGPPKPAFWEGMLLETTDEEKGRLSSGPGGQPEADGQSLLEPEVFISMNRFSVIEGQEHVFEERWASRESLLKSMPGFRFFQLMRRDQSPDDDVNYISLAVWDSRAAFDNWREGEAFKNAHGDSGDKPAKAPMPLKGPPKPYFYEGKLVLESEGGP